MPNHEGNRKIVVVFRVKIKAGLEEEYERRLGEVYELAAKSPGLQSLKGYAEPGGEKTYIIEWDSEESFNRWWSHPAHEKGTQGGSGESLTPGYGVQHAIVRSIRAGISCALRIGGWLRRSRGLGGHRAPGPAKDEDRSSRQLRR